MSTNFMVDYIKLRYTHPKKLSRKYYLEPLAFIFDIKSYKYSNRKLLIEAIISVIPQSKKYYNDCDPITLQNLDDVQPKFLYEWMMNDKIYAMHVQNLYKLIQNKQTILPWALDEVSGIYESEFPEEYKKKYDMKYQTGLIDDIEKVYHRLKDLIVDNKDDYTINIYTRERFKFENIVEGLKHSAHTMNANGQEMYVSHLVDIFLNLKTMKAFKIICYSINHCKLYFNNLYIDYILNNVEAKIYGSLHQFNSNVGPLIMLNNTFILIKDDLDPKYSCGVLRYMLLLLSELFDN